MVDYCAIIGDLSGSRRAADRAALQDRFRRELDRVNRTWEEAIAARFLITLGDEFQGLLRDPGPALAIVWHLQRRLHPARLLCGVGRGEILTELQPEAVGMDGPAFHRAREAVEAARRLEAGVVFSGFGRLDPVLSSVGELGWAILRRWTPRQREIVEHYLAAGSQVAAAGALGVGQPTVSKALARAALERLLRAEESVRELVRRDYAADQEFSPDMPIGRKQG